MYMSADQKACHQWLIEFEKMPDDTDKFTSVLDQTLQAVNSDYEAKRYKNITLQLPLITLARKNLFFDWLKSHNKLGGQNKVPRLKNNREIMDEILVLNNAPDNG
jgi:hypothetical protein